MFDPNHDDHVFVVVEPVDHAVGPPTSGPIAQELTLQGLEAALGVEIVRLDIFGFLHEVVASPASFGFTDVVDTCIRVNTVVQPFCPNPKQFLFWDGIHPTTAGHHQLAVRADAALDPKGLPLAAR